jgi:acetoin utilization deacetylase AcuC-like enzyme
MLAAAASDSTWRSEQSPQAWFALRYQQSAHIRLRFATSWILRMTTLLITHPACLNHLTPSGHPERPDRLRAIERALEHERFQNLARLQAPAAAAEVIALCHPIDYVNAIRDATPAEGLVRLDADTAISPGSFEAALRAAGGAIHAVEEVIAGRAKNAFVATRPPGHHAETARPMGFCLFNNAAIAARYAQRRHGIERAAVVDFDVHHGNGSQDIFWSDRTVMYASTHQMPLYPGTGKANERGEHNTIVNAPLGPGDGSEEFRAAFTRSILPRVKEFQPQLIVISAGFDAHMRDPLANLNLIEADFEWATRRLMEIADESANGRVISVLEGGYDLQALANSVSAHVAALMQG